MTLRAGILSDTHLFRLDDQFQELVRRCFADCSVIIHAGDITELPILDAFAGKILYAVHGNMCSSQVYRKYPKMQTFTLNNHQVGLTHGAGLGPDIELAMFSLFPEADCMIYGHTHRPIIHKYGEVLVINPGSFQATGRYGAPGTYAILEIGETLNASIHEVPQLP